MGDSVPEGSLLVLVAFVPRDGFDNVPLGW